MDIEKEIQEYLYSCACGFAKDVNDLLMEFYYYGWYQTEGVWVD